MKGVDLVTPADIVEVERMGDEKAAGAKGREGEEDENEEEEALMRPVSFARVIMKLEEMLEADFLGKYVKSGMSKMLPFLISPSCCPLFFFSLSLCV